LPTVDPTPCPLDECGVCNGPGKITCCDGTKVCDVSECPVSKPVSVCIALDESGSVCSIGSPNQCDQLAAGIPSSNCDYENNCPSFNNDTKDFARTLITGLDAVAESSFSVVTFARYANKDIGLTSAISAVNTVDNIHYSGGWTNTQAAIEECRRELENAPEDHLKFLVMVTDGLPTNNKADKPQGSDCTSCYNQAVSEATIAKDDDVTIIAVGVGSVSFDDALLLDIASDSNHVFSVTDYDQLDTVIDGVNQAANVCQDSSSDSCSGVPLCTDNLGAKLSAATGQGTIDPYPLIHTATLAKGYDNSAAVLVAGNFVVKKGAEIEGKIVTLGDFKIKSSSNFHSFGKVGVGSQVVPNNGEDVILVGGDLILEKPSITFMSPGYGYIVHKGNNIGNLPQLSGGSDVRQDSALDLSEWSDAFCDLEEKGTYWGGLTPNGIISGIGSWQITLRAGDSNCVQVFHFEAEQLQMHYGIWFRFHHSLVDKTIIINVKANANGVAKVFNLADFLDTTGARGFSFSSALVSQILWNFYDAKEVELGCDGHGNGEFRGSILVPQSNSTMKFCFPGQSGRTIVNGDLEQNRAGSEFHNYDFDPPCHLPNPLSYAACIDNNDNPRQDPSQYPSAAPITSAPTTGKPTTSAPVDCVPSIDHTALMTDGEVEVDVSHAKGDPPSYLQITYSNGTHSGESVSGWCVDVDRRIGQKTYHADMYSSYEANQHHIGAVDRARNLTLVNWLINNIPNGDEVDATECGLGSHFELTWREYQRIIWKLVDFKDGSNLIKDNKVENCVVDMIVDIVLQQDDTYEPDCNDSRAKIALLLVIDAEDGITIKNQVVIAEVLLSSTGACVDPCVDDRQFSSRLLPTASNTLSPTTFPPTTLSPTTLTPTTSFPTKETALPTVIATEAVWSCSRPKNCSSHSCAVQCPSHVPAGYYPDLNDCQSYCKCTGTHTPSRYETCLHGLYYDPLRWNNARGVRRRKKGSKWLGGGWGRGTYWGSNGGSCSWPSYVKDDRPSSEKFPRGCSKD